MSARLPAARTGPARRTEHGRRRPSRPGSISAIETAPGSGKRRQFDAQEILAFACAFDLPLFWFLLPLPGDDRRLRNTSYRVDELYRLVLGRDDQSEVLYARFRELGMAEPDEQDAAWAPVMRTSSKVMLNDYRRRREELLLRLLDEYADRVDASADEWVSSSTICARSASVG